MPVFVLLFIINVMGFFLKELSQPFVPYKHRPLNKQLKLLNSVRLTFSSDFSVSRKQKLCLNNLMQSSNSEPFTDAAWSQKTLIITQHVTGRSTETVFFFFILPSKEVKMVNSAERRSACERQQLIKQRMLGELLNCRHSKVLTL